ncbi:hypothetical protein CVT24_002395 [Panaeolus cyanescens]|uniref:F-box domain-containing protein n=1 Tax=Panaeolus cyanescens TaxID=181874 RepID=A0A409W149_9AGAR|nr:hypothetical protein CVT24_002395 [Panaeolus cyanescens]
MASSYCILPYEIMLQIFNLLSKDRLSLYKLLYLSPSYRPDLERMLYRSMTAWLGYPTFRRFLNSILNNPRLASYVHRFAIVDNEEWDQEPEKTFPENSGIWKWVLQALECMVNLKAFVVDVEDSNPPTDKIVDLFIRTGRQLHELAWCAGYENSFTRPQLLRLLVRQSELRILRTNMFDSYYQENDMPVVPICCPKVRHIRSPAHVVKKFMRDGSRPITSLVITGVLDPNEIPLPDFSRLEELTLWEPPSKFLNARFPKVTSLKLSCNMLLKELDQMSRFPALKEITTFDTRSRIGGEEFIKIFSICKKLEVVLIGPKEIYYHPMASCDLACKFERWTVKRTTGLDGKAVVEPVRDGYEVIDCSADFRDIRSYRQYSLWKSRLDKGVFY